MSRKQHHHHQSHHLDYVDGLFCGPIEQQQQRQHNRLDGDLSQREEELVPRNGEDEKENESNQLVTTCGDTMLGVEPQ